MPFGEAVGEGFTSSEVLRVTKVIVSGPGEGVFVYNGTPALGNPPIFWAGSSPDPEGNVLPSTAGVAGTGTFQAGNTIINASGIFTYSSTPAAGNLVSSSGVAAAGTDGFGNHYLQGNASYQAAFANAMIGGAVIFYTGSLAGGWTLQSEILIDSSGDLLFSAANAVATGNLTVDGTFTNGGQTGGPNGTLFGLTTSGASAGTAHTHTLPFQNPTATHTHNL